MLCRLHAARLKALLQGWPTEAGSNPPASSTAADLGHIAVHCFSPEAHEKAQGLLRALAGAVDAPGHGHGIGDAVATAAELHAAAGMQASSGWPAAGIELAETEQAAAGMQAGSGVPAADADPAVAERALQELLLKDCLDAMRWLAASRPNCHKVVYRWAMCRVPCRPWLTEEAGTQLSVFHLMSSAETEQHHSDSNLMHGSCRFVV